jgi:hypothetical protein
MKSECSKCKAILVDQKYKLCEQCRRYKRDWRRKNQDKIAANNRAYHQKNKAKVLARRKRNYQKNRDEILAKRRAKYREKNPPKLEKKREVVEISQKIIDASKESAIRERKSTRIWTRKSKKIPDNIFTGKELKKLECNFTKLKAKYEPFNWFTYEFMRAKIYRENTEWYSNYKYKLYSLERAVWN